MRSPSSIVVLLFTTSIRAATNATSQALNQTNYNLVAQAPGGPVLYYNGTGDVPSYNLTSPDPIPITPFTSSGALEDVFYTEVFSIANGTTFMDNCSRCLAGAEVMHLAAVTLPVANFVNLAIRICNSVPAVKSSIYADTCSAAYGSIQNGSTAYSSGGAGTGAYYAQLFSKMTAATNDFNTYCYYNWKVCTEPPTIGINEDLYFNPKPQSANVVPTPSSKFLKARWGTKNGLLTMGDQTINVLHISDWHIDPRYDIGSEANCSQYMCCRPYSTNTGLHTNVNNASIPASRFGAFDCDSPADLALSSLSTMPQFFNMSSISFSIYTGDIVSHDNDDQLSRAYVSYSEEITYRTFKAYMGDIPIYATLGNHDTLPEAMNIQNSISSSNGTGNNPMSWNYQLLSSLWAESSWINPTEASYTSTHYGAFAHTTAQGLRIISLNADFWYRGNPFNYWNVTNPDQSGILKFLADELTACESRNQRAWVISHVLTGYDGGEALPNPTALFYSIIRRFSPNTITGVFFGHTHEDQIQLFYDYLPSSTYIKDGITYRNTSMVDYSKPLQIGYIGPSITPLSGLNAGYQLYQVDAATFSVTGIQTYIANISQATQWSTPIWQFEYDARQVYGEAAAGNGSIWPTNAPLNATFWDNVAKSMLKNGTLVELYNLYETKSSVITMNCTSEACRRQKVCYIRSGSSELGRRCGKSSGPL